MHNWRILEDEKIKSEFMLLNMPLCRRCLCWQWECEAASLWMVWSGTWCPSRPISSLAILANIDNTTRHNTKKYFSWRKAQRHHDVHGHWFGATVDWQCSPSTLHISRHGKQLILYKQGDHRSNYFATGGLKRPISVTFCFTFNEII